MDRVRRILMDRVTMRAAAVRWVSDGCQMGVRWVSDACQMGVRWRAVPCYNEGCG